MVPLEYPRDQTTDDILRSVGHSELQGRTCSSGGGIPAAIGSGQ